MFVNVCLCLLCSLSVGVACFSCLSCCVMFVCAFGVLSCIVYVFAVVACLFFLSLNSYPIVVAVLFCFGLLFAFVCLFVMCLIARSVCFLGVFYEMCLLVFDCVCCACCLYVLSVWLLVLQCYFFVWCFCVCFRYVRCVCSCCCCVFSVLC